MSDTQLPLPATQSHQNHQHFSDYYLNEILPQRPEWLKLGYLEVEEYHADRG